MLRISLFAAAALLAACATQPPADQASNDCFNADMINGYDYIDENHVAVNVGANRRYILTTLFDARQLDWTQVISVHSNTNWICVGNGLGVEVRGGSPRRSYPISAIERAPDTAPEQQGS
jgi:Family of unknown function (DUF6491)